METSWSTGNVSEGSRYSGGDVSPQQALRRHGSIRKVVHPGGTSSGGSGNSATNDPNLLYGVPAKMLEASPRWPADGSSAPYHHPHFLFIQEYSITSELNMLGNQSIPGLYAIPSAKSPLVWFGVLFIRSGIYCGGVFRFNVFLPETFPKSTRPRIVFESEVYHPLIDVDTQEVNLRGGFPEWKSGIHHLWQALLYVRNMFYDIQKNAHQDTAAAKMLRENRLEFERRAEECARHSVGEALKLQSTQFSDDPHYLKFDKNFQVPSPTDDTECVPLLQDWNGPVATKRVGLSWVRKGTLETFSKLVS